MRLPKIVFSTIATFGLIVNFSEVAIGSGPPDWTQKTPADDPEYFYFVGFGEDQSLANAKALAGEDARRKVLQQFTGVYSEFTQRTKETNSNFESSKLSNLQSDLVQIRGLKEIETYRNTEQNKEQIYILYGLPKGEAAALKATESSRPKGDLSLATIATSPAGALARVNGRTVGKAPLKIFLPIGRVNLNLRLPGYKVVSKVFYLERARDLNVHYALEVLMGTVNVRCAGAGARVEWNGNEIESYKNVEVPAGRFELKVSRNGSKSNKENGILPAGKTMEFCLTLEDLEKPKRVERKETIVTENLLNTSQHAVDKAFQAARRGRYKEALKAANEMEALQPEDPIFHAIRAQVFVDTKFYAKAFREESAFVVGTRDAAAKKDARAFLCYIGGMDARFGSGSALYEGLQVCETALEESPMNAFAHIGIALLYEKQRKFTEARNSFQTAAALDPKYGGRKRAFCRRNRYHSDFYLGGC